MSISLYLSLTYVPLHVPLFPFWSNVQKKNYFYFSSYTIIKRSWNVFIVGKTSTCGFIVFDIHNIIFIVLFQMLHSWVWELHNRIFSPMVARYSTEQMPETDTKRQFHGGRCLYKRNFYWSVRNLYEMDIRKQRYCCRWGMCIVGYAYICSCGLWLIIF